MFAMYISTSMSLKFLGSDVAMSSFTGLKSVSPSLPRCGAFARRSVPISAREPLALKRNGHIVAAGRKHEVNAASTADEVELLQHVLSLLKANKEAEAAAAAAEAGNYSGGGLTVEALGSLVSPISLKKFAASKYALSGEDSILDGADMSTTLRSQKFQGSEVPPTVRCIDRFGAETST